MAAEAPLVIVGAGLAGGNAAATLREEGYDGRVVLIGHEPGVPFGRPPLSKTFLRSEEELDGWYVKPPGWYEDHGIERLAAVVVAIDRAAHALELDSGEQLSYGRLLIATGGRKRPRPGPGAGLPRGHSPRTGAVGRAIKPKGGAGGPAGGGGGGVIGGGG